MQRFERALEERFDDRRLAPAFFEKTQADFFDQGAGPVVARDFVERFEAQVVRQAQVVEPARIVEGDGVGAGAAGARCPARPIPPRPASPPGT